MSVIDQKRIAKNTLLLYIRMGLIMLISLYTSRVILSTLGEVDFGLYNVIGGIVVSFSFLNGIMSAACQRYFAIELGKGDDVQLKKVFSLNITIFIGLGILILILAETVGLWFLNHKMVIPPDRMNAAKWVYQLSILSFIINMMSTPYRSIIIARENMKVFAYSSVVEAVLKLAIAFLLNICLIDRLISYSALMAIITLCISLFYCLYATKFYSECHPNLWWDTSLFQEILGYTGWNLIGNIAIIGKSQGLNILLNMFFGPVVNAARGVAYQVYINTNQFVTNFVTAFNPQITKAYASQQNKELTKLLFQSSKISFFLLFFIVLPLTLELPPILDVWLKSVPNGTVLFTRLILINALIDSLANPLATAMQATGNVKWYQISVGGCLFFIVILSYFCLKYLHIPPYSVFIISIVFSIIAQFLRILFVSHAIKEFSFVSYTRQVLSKCIVISTLSAIIPIIIHFSISSIWIRFFTVTIVSFVCTIASVYWIGLSQSERYSLTHYLISKFKHES